VKHGHNERHPRPRGKPVCSMHAMCSSSPHPPLVHIATVRLSHHHQKQTTRRRSRNCCVAPPKTAIITHTPEPTHKHDPSPNRHPGGSCPRMLLHTGGHARPMPRRAAPPDTDQALAVAYTVRPCFMGIVGLRL
jgi:hypothetical protein